MFMCETNFRLASKLFRCFVVVKTTFSGCMFTSWKAKSRTGGARYIRKLFQIYLPNSVDIFSSIVKRIYIYIPIYIFELHFHYIII